MHRRIVTAISAVNHLATPQQFKCKDTAGHVHAYGLLSKASASIAAQ